LILRWLIAFAILIEKIIEIFHKPDCLMTWEHVVRARLVLQDGDLIFSHTDWELSNIFIPGPYKHVAVYIQGAVYEATAKGVRKVQLEEWILKKDHVGIARVKMPLMQMKSGIIFLDQQLGDPYNYDFLDTQTSKAWFCSMYAYKFLCTAIPGFEQIFTLRKTFGEQTVSPDDFWQATDKVTRIATLEA
jgi:hypothetical protein